MTDIVKRLDEQCNASVVAQASLAGYMVVKVDDVLDAKAEIERLRERLEMTHAWQMIDGKMTRVEVEVGSIPDGIECRDETIKQQGEMIARLRAERVSAKAGYEQMMSAIGERYSKAIRAALTAPTDTAALRGQLEGIQKFLHRTCADRWSITETFAIKDFFKGIDGFLDELERLRAERDAALAAGREGK